MYVEEEEEEKGNTRNQMVRGKGSNFPLVADKFVLQVSIVLPLYDVCER